jgi:transcriptional regulator with XRE-family HTH domain
MNPTRRNQARLRLIVDNESDGYRSGRRRWRDTPDTASIGRTRSAGIRPEASQPETVPCDLKPSARAKALWPPTASHAARSASVDMDPINAQTVNMVNANSGSRCRDNRRMAREPARQPSEFWKRLQEALKDKPLWQPLNANHVATRLKMSQGSVYRWFTGDGLPELDTALYLAEAGGVTVDWLLRGRKPKYPISSDPLLRSLFELCEDLNEDSRKTVLRTAENEKLRKDAEERPAADSTKKRA